MNRYSRFDIGYSKLEYRLTFLWLKGLINIHD